MKKCRVLAGIIFFCAFTACSSNSQSSREKTSRPPLDMDSLKKALSYARGENKSSEGWPRAIQYKLNVYDFKTDAFSQEQKSFELKGKPYRIVPHAVGVAEILWAICPRERIVAYNEFSADPEFSFIADAVKAKGKIFKSKQTELIIGYQPDLVFTVFYSDAAFKEKLKQAKIPFFDLGYFGTIDSIKEQILLIGRIIGEEGNASALIKIMDEKITELKRKIPKTEKPPRVLYYDEGGYIPGRSSNFYSICDIIGVINTGAEKGIKSWSQIDYETLLKWDPDIIFVPEGSNLKEQLMTAKILSHAKAVQQKKIYYTPGVYMRVDSQYMILSANLLAGIIYEK